MKFVITVGTVRIGSTRVWAGEAIQVVEADSADSALKLLTRMLRKRRLRPVGNCTVMHG